MTLSESLCLRLESCNPLIVPAQGIADFLDNHSTTYKIVLLFSGHLTRTSMVIGSMFIPGIPLYAKKIICFNGSLFYRLTVERNCAYKFSLPSFFGAMASMLAIAAIVKMIHHEAFITVKKGVAAIASLLPLCFYCGYIILAVDFEVNQQLKKSGGCKSGCKASN